MGTPLFSFVIDRHFRSVLTMSSSGTNFSPIVENNDAAEEHIEEESGVNGQTRRKLSRQFHSETNTHHPMLLRSRNVLSSINLNVANVPKETRKFFQAGTDKMNRKLRDVRQTFGTWSQRLKNPTRRRERLINNSPYTPGRTPRTKQLLGRTPTKLYRFRSQLPLFSHFLLIFDYYSVL